MTVSNWTEDRFDWRKATASIRNTYGDSFLFEVSNFVDVNNTDFSTIYASCFYYSLTIFWYYYTNFQFSYCCKQLDQPSLGLPSFILKGKNLTSYSVEAYFIFISGAALAIRDAIGGKASNDDIVKDIKEMITFNIELANVSKIQMELAQQMLTNWLCYRFWHQMKSGVGTSLEFTIPIPC